MDHHEDWGHWPEDDPPLPDPDADTVEVGDLGAGHDLDGHDPGAGHDPAMAAQDGEPGGELLPSLDLLHEGDTGPGGLDHHPDLTDADPGGPDGGTGHPGGFGPDPDLAHDPDPGPDHDAGGVPGHDGHDGDQPGDGYPGTDPGLGEQTVGADPDLLPDHAGLDHDFPPQLDLDTRPDPVDGYPWTDPGALGEVGGDAGYPPLPAADPDDLLSYAGLDAPADGADPWSLLLGADDPATSALARWWAPGG